MTKTKKRKFTVKLKKRDGQPAKTRGVGQTQPLASEPPETFADQIIRLVGAGQDPEIEEKYRAICGQARPVDELHAGDERIMDELAECVTTAFLASLEGERMEIGLQVHQLAPVPGHDAEICVPTIRKIGSFYQNAEADVIAAVRSCPIPGQGSTNPSLTRELVSIFYGSNARSKLDRALWKSPAVAGARMWNAFRPSGYRLKIGSF